MSALLSGLTGMVCGILSGFGIGGGSLLMVWMTVILSMEHRTAQAINLLFFLPSAVTSLCFHIKHKQIVWETAIPAMVTGALVAAATAWLSQSLDSESLRKIFGGFLILVGLSELFHKEPTTPGKDVPAK